MLNLGSIMLGTSQVEVMAEFYKGVFGREADMKEGGWYGWQSGIGFLTIGEHSEVKGQSKEPPRIMFVFTAKDVQKEYDRIMALNGAKEVKAPYEMGGGLIATIADPDGNYFQLMTPWEDEQK